MKKRIVILREWQSHCLNFETGCDEGWPWLYGIPDDNRDDDGGKRIKTENTSENSAHTRENVVKVCVYVRVFSGNERMA